MNGGALAPGVRVGGRFEVRHRAAAGGMATVYRAVDTRTGHPAALKVVLDRTAELDARVEREARALSAIAHPAVVPILDHGRDHDVGAWLAMPWLDGEDLAQRLGRGPLDPAEATRLLRRVADALAVTHDAGVLHRDLKPSNLFLCEGDIDRVVVIDFGLARIVGTSAVTRVGTLLGTPGYWAPEQARGEPADPRTDLFALGCVFYECLTGRPVFLAEHVMALLAKVLFEELPPPSALRQELPAELDALTLKLLARDPAARFQDARSLLHAVDALRAVRPTAPPAAPAATLTAGEQRVLSVLLAPGALAREGHPAEAAVRAASARLGGRAERLADGTAVVTFHPAPAEGALDLAARAARCALELRRLLPAAPMALATGLGQLAGTVPVGEVIDRAANLCVALPTKSPNDSPMGAPADVKLDEPTVALLDDRFEVDASPQGPSLRRVREAWDTPRTLLGRELPCLGRQDELTALDNHLEMCITERRARVVLLVGPSGVGKSRVRQEFLRAVGDRAEVLFGRGEPWLRDAAFGLLGSVLLRSAGVGPRDSLAVRRHKLRSRVGRHLPPETVERVGDFLGELCRVPSPEEGRPALRAARADPVLLGDQVRRAFEDFAQAELRARPWALVLEDLQHADEASLALLEATLAHLAGTALLVLGVGRAADAAGVFRGPDVARVELSGLGRPAALRLARLCLPSAATEVLGALVTRADGNVFYLEALLRAAAAGRLDPEAPAALAMVQTELEALEPDARRVLRAGAVFGTTFERAGLDALLGREPSPGTFDDALAALVSADLLTVTAEGYTFRHALVREAAYASLTEADRALGHRLAGHHLEATGRGRPAELGEHHFRGGDPSRAQDWFHHAAVDALRGNHFAGVASSVERAVRCGAQGEALGRLRRLQAEASRWAGQAAEALRLGQEALALLPPGTGAWFEAAGEVAVAAGHRSDTVALEAVGRALMEAPGPVTTARVVAAVRLLFTGRLELAASLLGSLAGEAPTGPLEDPRALWDHLARAHARLLAVLPNEPLAEAWLRLGWALGALRAGDLGGCVEEGERAARCFEAAGDWRNAILARVNVGHAYNELGMFPLAVETLEAALEAARRVGVPHLVSAAQHNLGWALAGVGRWREADEVESAAVEALWTRGDRRLELVSRSYLARIQVGLGDLAGAEREVLAALEGSAQAPATRPHLLGSLAAVRLAQGALPAALAAVTEATALLDAAGGMEGDEALVRRTHAEVLGALGDRAGLRAVRAWFEARAGAVRDLAWRARFLRQAPWVGPEP
jgi:tetratricopeptide (TPR) repeat protein